jgi:hypothetical protein
LWRIVAGRVGRRAAFILGQASLFRAGIVTVGHAVTIPVALRRTLRGFVAFAGSVGTARLRTAVTLRKAPFSRTGVFTVGHAIAIAVDFAGRQRATPPFRRTGLVRAGVVAVRNLVAIGVGAPHTGKRSGLRGAGVVSIGDAVAIAIGGAGHWAPIPGWRAGRARLFRAGVLGIGHAVAVAIGAALRRQGAGLIRAGIVRVGHAVAVHVRAVRAAVVLGPAGLVGADVVPVGHAITVGVGAAIGTRGTRVVGAGIGLIQDAVAVAIPLRGRGASSSIGEARLLGTVVLAVGDTIPIPVRAASRSR